MSCQSGISDLDSSFLKIYQSLSEAAESSKVKRNQVFTLLEKIVKKEWPHTQLILYGSSATPFTLSESDIDVSLTTDNKNMGTCYVLSELANILRLENFDDIKVITLTRVPVLKMKDPITSISCDICVNNMLAVEKTKMIRDYAEIDVRLTQLVLIVKHWAKSRGVNDASRGTLSSYSYVLMCIHLLQRRSPPILPCLQRMETTYSAIAEHIECSYFDRVEELRDFGVHNKESIVLLVWAFFDHWAHCHDYSNDVVSVRTGEMLSKSQKGWYGYRDMIGIEDPFEVSHNLGRVVDRYTLKFLRNEFERGAKIMQEDPDPFVSLFEPN